MLCVLEKVLGTWYLVKLGNGVNPYPTLKRKNDRKDTDKRVPGGMSERNWVDWMAFWVSRAQDSG